MVAQGTELQRQAEPRVGPPAPIDQPAILVGQGEVLDQGGLVGGECQQRGALGIGEQSPARHVASSIQ